MKSAKPVQIIFCLDEFVEIVKNFTVSRLLIINVHSF